MEIDCEAALALAASSCGFQGKSESCATTTPFGSARASGVFPVRARCSSSARRAGTRARPPSRAPSSRGSAGTSPLSASSSPPSTAGADRVRAEGMAVARATASRGRSASTEEKGRTPRKDTSRMLQSGALKVFWARSRSESLRECLADLRTGSAPGPSSWPNPTALPASATRGSSSCCASGGPRA